jgi:hypothetical protein
LRVAVCKWIAFVVVIVDRTHLRSGLAQAEDLVQLARMSNSSQFASG